MSSAEVTTVHEAYSFACMKCGYGWEQAYAIEHHTDADGRPLLIHYADGKRVPSPLGRRLTCPNCDSTVVRIMRSGRVTSAEHARRGHLPQGWPRH